VRETFLTNNSTHVLVMETDFVQMILFMVYVLFAAEGVDLRVP
jgi:hypothetical protein